MKHIRSRILKLQKYEIYFQANFLFYPVVTDQPAAFTKTDESETKDQGSKSKDQSPSTSLSTSKSTEIEWFQWTQKV